MESLIINESEQLKKELQLVLNPQIQKLGAIRPDFIGWRDFLSDGTSLSYCSNNLYYTEKPIVAEASFHYMQEILWLNRRGFKIVVRTPSLVNNAFLKKLENMDMCNSIIIYKKDINVIQMFCFIFKANNIGAMSFFVNEKEKFEVIAEKCLNKTLDISKSDKYFHLRDQLFSNDQAASIFEDCLLIDRKNTNYSLSKRQKECLDLIVQGATNKDIANILDICPKTVEYHLKKIRETLHCHTRFDIKQKYKQQII